MRIKAPAFQLNMDALLLPLTAEQPAGTDLRYDPVYDQIRNLRREDDQTLPQGVWKSEQKRADWHAVELLCFDTLTGRSKDLQIAAWLMQALVRLYGFDGAAEGFRLIHGLCETFWEELHPRIEAGDAEYRIAPLVWLNNRLPLELKLLPLTEPEADAVPACSLADWEIAAQTSNLQNRHPHQPTADREMTLAHFQQSAILTATPHIATLVEAIRTMDARCRKLEKLLDEKLGRESPGLLGIRGVAESASTLLESLLKERKDFLALSAPEPFGVPEAETPPEEADAMEARPPGQIRSRSEAYWWLAEAADFLAQTEPHSPASYLVRRAIAWGSMSLEELLPELVRDRSELAEIYRLLNVRGPDAPQNK